MSLPGKGQQEVIDRLKSKPFFRRYYKHVNKLASTLLPGMTNLNFEMLNQYFPDTGSRKANEDARDAVDILEDSPFAGFSINIGP